MAGLALVMGACKQSTAAEPSTPPAPVADPVRPSDDAAQTSGLETLIGTYVTTEQGDYMHAVIKGEDGTEYSFFLANDFPEARVAELSEGLWDGKRVKVQWRKTERDIPENGGKTEIDELVSIEQL